jgi:hypothetical protein
VQRQGESKTAYSTTDDYDMHSSKYLY